MPPFSSHFPSITPCSPPTFPVRGLGRAVLLDRFYFCHLLLSKLLIQARSELPGWRCKQTHDLLDHIHHGREWTGADMDRMLLSCMNTVTNSNSHCFYLSFYSAAIQPTVLQSGFCWSLLCFEIKSETQAVFKLHSIHLQAYFSFGLTW